MSGSPIDGLSWWAKGIFYSFLAPAYACEAVGIAVTSVAKRVKRLVRPKSKEAKKN